MSRPVIELDENERLFFAPYDNQPGGGNLGHAEFAICTAWKDGWLREIHISPMQQRDADRDYYVRLKAEAFSFSNIAHRPFGNPAPWYYPWCSFHQGPSCWIYVPKDTNCLYVRKLSTADIIFDFRQPDAPTDRFVNEQARQEAEHPELRENALLATFGGRR